MIYLKRHARIQGGRGGHITTPNGSLDLTLAKPEEMGGEATTQTNPEELFVAGYVACLASSFEFLAAKMNASYTDLNVEGTLVLEDHEALGGFQFGVNVTFTLTGLDEAVKTQLVEQTLSFCPFSRAIKGNVTVDYQIL